MKVGDSVRLALADWDRDETQSAMLHACNAVDGTAGKVHPALGNKKRFTTLLRDNYAILGPMGAPGIDLVKTRFPVRVRKATAPGGHPDIADVIYGIHRCSHGHGDELPRGFELLRDARGPDRHTRMQVQRGRVQLSDRMIFGLVAVAVLSPANADQVAPDAHHLRFAGKVMPISKWWGRAADFPFLAATDPTPLVELDFGDWMDAAKK